MFCPCWLWPPKASQLAPGDWGSLLLLASGGFRVLVCLLVSVCGSTATVCQHLHCEKLVQGRWNFCCGVPRSPWCVSASILAVALRLSGARLATLCGTPSTPPAASHASFLAPGITGSRAELGHIWSSSCPPHCPVTDFLCLASGLPICVGSALRLLLLGPLWYFSHHLHT